MSFDTDGGVLISGVSPKKGPIVITLGSVDTYSISN